ncbi:MAG TPA: hypothetical protein VHS06_06425 [Chloroflexota bacterium]|nr:hypothetical protein [Chloroflexota bacterium]
MLRSVQIGLVAIFVLSACLVPSTAFATVPGEAPAATASGDTQAAAPAAPKEVRFGAVEAYTTPFRARESGVSWERAIYRWDQFQPSSAQDWKSNIWFPDSSLAVELAEGRKVVGIVLGTPQWLAGPDPNAAFPNLNLPYDSPDNYWGQFMRRLVAQYAGRIDDWIIWNEPDIWNNSANNQQFNGSVEQYYQMVKVAYQAAKSVNPKSRIVLAGLTYWWDQAFGREQYFHRFLNVAKQDPTARANGFYFDVAAIHLYGNPQDLYDVTLLFKKMMREVDLDKPVWINETNVVPHDDGGVVLGRDSYRASMEEQASYIIQAFACAMAAGDDRISVYKMQDDTDRPGAEPYGLVRADEGAAPRPAYQAYQVVTNYMSGARSVRYFKQGSLAAIRIEREKDWVTVLWDSSPTGIQAVLPARSPKALLVDKYGHGREALPKNGKYFVDLEGATANTVPGAPAVYHIGGSPLLLVEGKVPGVTPYAPVQDWSAPGVNAGKSWVSQVTGYSVSGEWLDYYRSHGDSDVLGHPLGSVRPDPANAKQYVQYFERGILEWHPENAAGQRVQKRLMGDVFYPGYVEAAVDPQNAAQKPQGDVTFFPNQPGQGFGHYVANFASDGTPTHFREFFGSHGGVESFGYPKEEPKLRNGRWTQRFQAGMLVAYPDAGKDGGSLVRLDTLGEKALGELTLPMDW